jgi:hypothetical protein
MLDIGLLSSILVIVAVMYAAARWAPVGSMHANETIDRLYLPALAAIFSGRVAAAALDDPTSLRSLRALLVLRGGVEFWPGVAVGVAVLALGLRRSGRPIRVDLVDLAPFMLWGYGAWELTCWLRDGCFGPATAFGLTPDGLTRPQFPVGLVMGMSIVGLGFVVRHLWALEPNRRLLVALGGVASVRAIGSIWLPHLGSGMTRHHEQSVAIALVAVVALGFGWWRTERARRVPVGDQTRADPDDVDAATEAQIRPHRVFRPRPGLPVESPLPSEVAGDLPDA